MWGRRTGELVGVTRRDQPAYVNLRLPRQRLTNLAKFIAPPSFICPHSLFPTTPPQPANMSIELPAAADFHVHLRDGSMMETVVPTVRQGGVNLAYVMVCSCSAPPGV